MMNLAITIPGRPVTWQRKRIDARGHGKPRTFTDAGQTKAMEAIQAAVVAPLQTWRSLNRWATWDLAGAFEVVVTSFYGNAVVGDVDRAAGLILDALQGVLWKSDRQVRTLLSRVIADGSPPRTEVTVRRLAVDPVVVKRPRLPRTASRAPHGSGAVRASESARKAPCGGGEGL